MLLAAIFRVVAPLIMFSAYPLWVGMSQVFWILSFLVFAFVYIPMLIKPRIDGQYG